MRRALWLLYGLAGAAGATDSPLEAADYQLVQEVKLAGIAADASGLTYNPDRDRLLVIVDHDTALFEYTRSGQFQRKIELDGFEDTEDIAYLGDDEYVVIEERTGMLLKILVSELTQRVHRDSAFELKHLGGSAHNDGMEGLAYGSDTGNLYLAHERLPRAVSVLNLHKPFPRVTELWTLSWYAVTPLDYSGIAYRAGTGLLWLLSDNSSSITEYTASGNEVGRLKLRKHNGKRLRGPEGIAVAPDGMLYVVSEPNRLYIFAPNHARFVRESR